MSGAKMTQKILLLAILLTGSLSSHALSCQTQTMERSFEQASQVFLAQITSTELLEDARDVPEQVRYQFRVLETFKGEVDYSSFESELAWNTNAAHFSVGDTSLFFMGDSPGFNDCTPQYLLGQTDTSFVLSKLRKLNRSSESSISGLWAAKSSAKRCSIYTTYLLEETSGTVSVSLGLTPAAQTRPARSSIWIYSQARRDDHVIGDSGLTLSFAKQKVAIPHDKKSLSDSANFYSRLEEPGQINRLLSEVLSQKEVYLHASTRSKQDIEIPVMLNGGAAQILEFAQCANLELAYNPLEQ
ncbi:MAG: hypothetical protein AB8G18_12795 [Gammaproteobacteria bacterium]